LPLYGVCAGACGELPGHAAPAGSEGRCPRTARARTGVAALARPFRSRVRPPQRPCGSWGCAPGSRSGHAAPA